MKKYVLFSLLVVFMTSISFNAMAQWRKKKKEKETVNVTNVVVSNQPLLKNNIDTVSYMIGADIAKNFRTNGIVVNEEFFLQGFKDGQSRKDTLFTEEQVGTCL